MAKEKSREFIKALGPLKSSGFSPWAIYTHACHETGYFRRVAGKHNYWRIEKPARWQGPVARDWDQDDGANTLMEFVDWESCDEALAFYAALVEKIYPESFAARACHNCFLRGLAKWDADSAYSDKLLALYDLLRGEEQVGRDFNVLLPA